VITARPRGPDRPVPVVSLSTCPGALERIALWFQEAWPAWYGPGGQGDARRDLDRCLTPPGRLPRCLIALDDTAEPVGTVSLRDTSPGSDRYPGVWLTALFVPEAFRRAGIGTALVAAAEREAAGLGFQDILVSTATAQSLMQAWDWRRIDGLRSPGGDLDIFRKMLSAD
jgi:GNAT superfamily N-acetyltransferase